MKKTFVPVILSIFVLSLFFESQVYASPPKRYNAFEIFTKKIVTFQRGDKRTKNDLGQNVIYGQNVSEEVAKSSYVKVLNKEEESYKIGQTLEISLEASKNIDLAEVYLLFEDKKVEPHTIKFPQGKLSVKLDPSYEPLKAFRVEAIDLDQRISITANGSNIFIHNETPPDRIEDEDYNRNLERASKEKI